MSNASLKGTLPSFAGVSDLNQRVDGPVGDDDFGDLDLRPAEVGHCHDRHHGIRCREDQLQVAGTEDEPTSRDQGPVVEGLELAALRELVGSAE